MDGGIDDSTAVRPFNGRIMVSSVVLLIVACIIVLLFHSYSRWISRRRHAPPRRSIYPAAAVGATTEQDGLDFRTMNSLPVFVFNVKTPGGGEGTPPDCAVCLSEFEDGETGRILPGCKHCFHVDCIDMWFMSHSACPLCRTQVMTRPVKDQVNPAAEIVLPIFDTGPNIGGPSSPAQQLDPTKNGSHPLPDPDVEPGLKQPDQLIN